ncbi:MAG: PP2C family protein-serine/threonine phosphatase [Candidatus Gracilibacteria bacterium]|nr:PP2C family protein-serine/threonine phosphatase [Candidatus Gracilibacteria bacterium]
MIFSKIKKIFSVGTKISENITDISDALAWIKTYRKALNFDTAIIATKELILKNQVGITYYENASRKIAALENSNIEKIATGAREKHKKINVILTGLYKELNNLENIIVEIEKERLDKQDTEHQKAQKLKFKLCSQEINDILTKKDYVHALSFAKKLVSDFPNEAGAIKILTKVQKLYDGEKIKQEKEYAKEGKFKNILQEIGVDLPDSKEKKNVSIFNNLSAFIKSFTEKNLEKKEYLKRQKALKDVERLLTQSGTIENITDELFNSELLSITHSGLTKDINDFSLHGFDFFGKIHGKDKIVGDTFGYYKEGNKTLFYIGDATGHGVQSGFTVALLSKLFFEFSKKIRPLQELFVILNNELKQKLKGRIFVTSVFFEFNTTNKKLSFIGAGHDPMLVYRRKTNSIEKIIPGGLALGVRLIPNIASIKVKEIEMANGDILFGYTDGIIEVKDDTNTMYGLERMEKSFKTHAERGVYSPKKIYEMMLQDVNEFRGDVPFEDDMSFFIFSRNTAKDIIINQAALAAILKEMEIKETDNKKIDFTNKTKQQVIETLKKERYERDLKIKLDRLDRLYKMAEFTKLKQEVYLYFREGFAHDRMRFYLEKALENEHRSIMRKQDEKLKRKYEVLEELYKKGEYELVAKEVIDVLFKNGKI